jgi:hypothetical protein
MRKIFLTFIFAIFAPITLSLSLFSVWQIERTEELPLLFSQQAEKILGAKTPLELYSALPPAIGSVSQAIATGDARPILIEQYLEKYNSPLLPYADFIFEISEKYGLDYGLMVAIAMCESNVCKKIPDGSYNCWGFENGETIFLSWEQAIEQVAKTLKEQYYDKGLVTPEEIMHKYAPPSAEKGGPWAKCVNQFLEELR